MEIGIQNMVQETNEIKEIVNHIASFYEEKPRRRKILNVNYSLSKGDFVLHFSMLADEEIKFIKAFGNAHSYSHEEEKTIPISELSSCPDFYDEKKFS